MRKFTKYLAIAASCAIGLTSYAPAQAAEKLRIAYSVWVGYGPLFVAKEKGFFKEEGLDVDLVLMEDPKLRFAALAAQKIDLLATSVDTMPLYLKEGQSYRYLFGLDESSGADGLLVSNDIKLLKDLKGKKVGYSKGSVMEFLMSVLLKEAGLTLDDVEGVNMSAGDAGSAFLTKRIDAAATWEPYLSRGDKSDHGYKITDTSKYPGLLSDVMVARTDFAQTKTKEVAALYKAWIKAVDFIKAYPDEGNKIMGDGLGGWLKKPAVIADVLTGVSFMDAERNKAYMGSAATGGEIQQVIERSLDLWKSQDKLLVDVKPDALVSHAAFSN